MYIFFYVFIYVNIYDVLYVLLMIVFATFVFNICNKILFVQNKIL